MNVVVGFAFVVVQSGNALNAIPTVKGFGKLFQNCIGIKLCVDFRQSNHQFPCFDARSLGSASLEFLLTFPCKVLPEGRVCGVAGGIQVLLPLWAGDIGNASFDIWQLRHLDEAVSRHGFLSP